MSTIAHNLKAEAAEHAEVVVRIGRGAAHRAAARKQLSLTWSIARDAAVAAGIATGEGSGSVVLHMSLAWKRAVAAVTAEIVDGNERRPVAVAPQEKVEWLHDSERGLEHLDIRGVLRISVREVEPLAILYARTDLLAGLGLAGGRYEFEGAELIEG